MHAPTDLVPPRQRHLKWPALDGIERALMILCGLILFGFSTSVIFDIATRIAGRPWLWLQEVTSTLFIYGIFIGAAVADRALCRGAARQWMAARLRSSAGPLRARGAKECFRGDRACGGHSMNAPLILALMTFLFLFFGYMGVPVAFSLMAGVLVGTLFTDVTFPAIIQKMFDGMDSEALLAIPFFLLVGELMSSANVVVRIANLSLALVGHIRGGLSQTVAVFSMFFSEMSGSTTADVAVISRALGGPMKKEGYSPAFIAAIIAAASTIAALVPPSITAVVYGAIGNVSIAGLFMAGVVPGLMIGFGLMIYCYFFAPVTVRRPRAPLRQVVFAAGDAALPLMIP